MKKILLFSLLTLGLVAPKASAITNTEFSKIGKIWRTVRLDHITYADGPNLPTITEGNIEFVVDSDDDLNITGLVDENTLSGVDGGVMYAKINGNTVVCTANIGEGYFYFTEDGTNNGYPNCRWVKYILLSGNNNGTGVFLVASATGVRYLDSYLTGTISQPDNYGNYKIEFGPYKVVKATRTNGYINAFEYNGVYQASGNTSYFRVSQSSWFGGATFQTYSANATVSDTKNVIRNNNLNSFSSSTNRTYDVSVYFNENNIYFENFCNLGNPFSYSSGPNSTLVTNQGYVSGPYDLESGEFTLGQASYNCSIKNNALYVKYLYAGDLNSYQKISGRIEKGSIGHYGTNKWLNVLQNKTIQNIKIYIDDYITDDEQRTMYTNHTYDSKYTNTIVDVHEGEGIDISHDLKVQKNEYGRGQIRPTDPDTYLYINCELTNFKNSKYVEDYELYLVPEISNPNYNSSDFKDENGHVNGTRIDLVEYASGFEPSDSDRKVRAKASGEESDVTNPFEGYKYNLLIPENDLNARSANGKYQVYVKTIYTAESGLEPTFHALTTLGDTTTGVEDILDNGEIDNDAPVYYYNMNGVLMDGNNLAPGLYIRRQGTTSEKVVIR